MKSLTKSFYCLCLAGCLCLAACNDSSPGKEDNGTAGCNPGRIQCGTDNKSTVTCNDNGEWGEAVACPQDKPVCDNAVSECVVQAATCSKSQKQCYDDKHIQYCGDDGFWKVPEACPDDKPACDNSSFSCVAPVTGECSLNQTKCEDAANIRACGADGNWGDPKPCPDDKPVCDTSKDQCVPADDECVTNDTECEDSTHRKVCGEDHKWHVELCPNDKPTCYPTAFDCVSDDFECVATEVKCADDFKGTKTCGNDNKWETPVPCPDESPVCDAGSVRCVERGSECETDAFECTGTGRYRACGDDGLWQADTDCPSDKPVCSDEAKNCVAEKCTPTATKCSGEDSYQTCDDNGEWSDPSPCPDDTPICNAEKDECVETSNPPECTPDTDFCFGGNAESAAMYHCTAEGTKPVEPLYFCPDGCNDEGTECKPVKCTPKDIACAYDRSGVMTCKDDGTWDLDNIQKCQAGLSCNADTKQCECTPNVPVCTHIGSKSEGLYQCDAKGQIGERIEWCTCTDDYKACSCRIDDENSHKCQGINSMVCKDGVWTLDKSCDRSEFCNSIVGGVCIPRVEKGGICNEGESVCDDNSVLACNNGLYQPAYSGCTSSEICMMRKTDSGNAAKCVSTCKDYSYCTIEGITKCDKDGKITTRPCAKSQNCVMKPISSAIPEEVVYEPTCETYQCNEGEFYCGDEHVLSVCHNNELVKLAKCSDYNMPCVSGKDGGCFVEDISAPLP